MIGREVIDQNAVAIQWVISIKTLCNSPYRLLLNCGINNSWCNTHMGIFLNCGINNSMLSAEGLLEIYLNTVVKIKEWTNNWSRPISGTRTPLEDPLELNNYSCSFLIDLLGTHVQNRRDAYVIYSCESKNPTKLYKSLS